MMKLSILLSLLSLLIIKLVISYDNNDNKCILQSENICQDIRLIGRYIHAGILLY
jgi:hypothetical protein